MGGAQSNLEQRDGMDFSDPKLIKVAVWEGLRKKSSLSKGRKTQIDLGGYDASIDEQTDGLQRFNLASQGHCDTEENKLATSFA